MTRRTRGARIIRALLALSCSVVYCAAGAVAAAEDRAKPDLTGTWVLDRGKSNFGPFAGSPVTRTEVTLIIAHAGPELKITRRSRAEGGGQQTQELAFYTDGRGELNPATLGRVGTKTKSAWEGGRIVSRAKLERRAPNGKSVTFEVAEKWELSADGRTLTQTTSAGSPSGVQTVKLVYRRAP